MSPVQGKSPPVQVKNPTVISIWLLVGFHPATRSVQCTPADNARKRAPGSIERKKDRKNNTAKRTDPFLIQGLLCSNLQFCSMR